MDPTTPDLLQGTLDLLVLKTLQLAPNHGWAISKRIREMSRDALTVNQGSLYPALYRLEERGWIAGEAGRSPEGRAIKIYRILPAGRHQLAREIKTWHHFALAIGHVLQTS